MKKNKKQELHFHPLGCFAMLFVYTLALWAGFGILSLLFHYLGRQPPALWAHMLTGFVTGAVLVLFFILLFIFASRNRKARRDGTRNKLTEAMQQISQGNFDVFLDTNDFFIPDDLALAINDMAKNLGTLESMRQDFISNVSHEIQSPLTSINGFAALIKQDHITPEERRRYAQIIESESSRLSSLSENLLKLSSLESSKVPLNKISFRLDQQLETVALTLEPQWMKKQIQLEADLEKCTVWGDADLLMQVWMNLLHNAVKFTPTGGSILISLKNDGEMAVVKISDTGVGISPKDQIHIFERFYKVDKARDRSLGGNGLGLSLVKRIVDLHEGQITVASKPQEGTVFEISLPCLH